MKAKAIIAMLVAIVFTLGVVGLSFATEAKEMKGTITKIEGNKVTVKDDAGKETTVDVKDAKGAKVGDKVTIKDGAIVPAAKKKVTGC